MQLFIRPVVGPGEPLGTLVNEKFVINDPELSGGLNSVNGGTIPGEEKGGASWLIIPRREAAPTPQPQSYEVSGLMTYTHDGDQVSVNLWPDEIEVGCVFPEDCVVCHL